MPDYTYIIKLRSYPHCKGLLGVCYTQCYTRFAPLNSVLLPPSLVVVEKGDIS